MRSFHLVSLGCAKNLVDSELIIGNMTTEGWRFVEDPEAADLLMLNTCGFIQPAVEEAIEEILELARIKEQHPEQKLVVVGCLVQRYKETLPDELPEVDLFVGTEGCHDMAARVGRLFGAESVAQVELPDRFIMDSSLPRTLTTPFFRAWFKVTEGCDNRCSYCMIPSIRGNLRSRPIDDLLREACRLEAQGVRELSLIAQDLTAYGNDLGQGTHLTALLERLLRETTIPWLRLLYLYPSGIDERLLALMADNERIVPYLDIPFQHVSSRVLQGMNRRYTSDDLYRLIERIRRYLPEVALRTTFLVGFPGETERDLDELITFLKDSQLDHVGVFPYANEEGCGSEHFPGQVDDEEKLSRRDRILAVQAEISTEIQKKYIGREELVLVEGVSRETDLLLEGRTRFQAPDVDGCVYINDGTANPGDLVKVLIEESQVYDLVGGIVGEAQPPR
ncbi:30S ribosomal protein S12 methylthiotransferase RimO [Desulfopila aestuarii]|uniref:Ribosomal protein uS12 methylthiotransferase RimO n=1 Tax=Desulfopila aestuarii DSM 18488 TaxID=1121416 RepID=A0A1M7Y2L0_9BACT|nr:30S ribosomal protein S12 methylthiotransferase RimO [Desulfopila aestuarii]SHO46177.1 SSU ribosomal protein S12P methylthiotransferase [Desulfopila aestuarii DSM 18488]